MLGKEKPVKRVHQGAACFKHGNNAFFGEELDDFHENFV